MHGPQKSFPTCSVVFSGNTNAAKVSFITEVTQEVVYTCEEPPLVVSYDRQLSTHSIWTYRQAKPEVHSSLLVLFLLTF